MAVLMKPVFFNGKFNKDGKRMRAELVREISNGVRTYRIWRSSGKPDIQYPRSENDAYLLYVEVNGYLAPLSITDAKLIDCCGYKPAALKLYGGLEGQREQFLRELPEDKFSDTMEQERHLIEEFGTDPINQINYISQFLASHIAQFQNAKVTDGKTFPDFIGAVALNEVSTCLELREKYNAVLEEKDRAERAKQEAEDLAFCEQNNKEADNLVLNAINTLRTGGKIENDTLTYYKNRYESSSVSLINHLFYKFGIDVPLRTRGWINAKLAEITIEDGKCTHLLYRSVRGGKCSQAFFDYMNQLINIVNSKEEQ